MQIKNFYTATLLKKFLFGFAIFFVFSCDNYGCVETDDFGEYDSYSFPVYANNLENLCKYDRKKDPSDSTQGLIFRKIYEKDNCLKNTEVERITCGLKVEKLCKINPNSITTEEKTQIFSGVAPKSLSETPWIGIGGSNGIKIEEDSRILINAVGEIKLGENSIKDPAKIVDTNKDDFGNPEKNSSKFIHSSSNKSEISGNENLFVNFWGKFVSNGTTYLHGADTQYINDLNRNPPQKSISDNRLNYYNDETYSAGAKRILAYFIPFPNYVKIDADKKNISALFPNPKSWNCVLSDNGSNDNIRCSNNAGLNDLDKYTTAEDVELNITSDEDRKAYNDKYTKLYQVDNLSKNRMYENTGFLRFENDGLVGSANYLDSSSANIIDINLALIPTTFSKYQLQAPASKNYKLKFKKEGVCAGFKFSKDGADGTYEDVFLVNDNPNLFDINIDQIDKLYIKTTADNSNSGCTLKAHFYEFLEIPITKSGYVKFDYPVSNIFLNNPSTPFSVTSNVNNCNLNFKIINTHKKPDGSYEYISETTDYTHNFTLKKDDKYFVRKGQKIIFSPESWNGSWSIAGNSNNNNYTFNFQCGKGFYMNHTPRPAVFCSNKKLKELIDINKDLDPSNDCSPYFDPNLKKETGCADDYLKSCAQLYGSGNSINTNFCPAQCINFNYFDTNCRPTCGADGLCSAPTNANCNPMINSTYCGEQCSVPTCKKFTDYAEIEPYKSQLNPATQINNLFSQTNCNNCLEIIKNNLIENFTIKTTNKLTQCYDLEDYTGSLKELNDKIRLINNDPDATAGSSLDPLVSLKDKNLKKLGSFNGSYGNLYPLEFVAKSSVTEYSIFRLKTPVFMPNSGYIKYIILNSDYSGDFDFVSANNGAITSADLNISLESSASKSNGQNLTIQLCMVEGNDYCSSLTKQGGTSITEEDIINTISSPNTRLGLISYGAEYSGLNNYNFDLNGYLYRTTSNRVGDDDFKSSLSECSIDPKSTNASYIGADFMCFRNGGNTNNDLSNNNLYRLSFKIIDDKETLNCLKSNPSSSCSSAACDGVKAINPNWDGKETSFCTESEKNDLGTNNNSCKKKFLCVDRYDNNSGKYDVVIRTKKRSDENASRFINSIISPVLGQIDGFDINKDINYQKNQTIQNEILSENVNKFFNNTDPDYLNENSFINVKINQYTPLDNKIISHKFISSSNGLFEIDLSKVDTDKCSRDNCIISYIAFAGFGKQKQIVANSVYLDKDYKYSNPRIVREYVRQNCDLKTQCKFPVSFENFGTATNIDKTFSEEPKLLVRYIYSYATQKIKQENLVKRLYNKIANDTNYKRILNLSIVLMFTFYGFGYLIGVSELKQSEIIDRVIKIGIIYLFTNPDFGWIWFEKFFVDGFKNGADFLTFTMASIFDDSGSIENSIKNGVFIDKSPLFSSADNIINLFISNDAIHKKIGALLFYKLFGIIYLFIIYHSIFNYIYAISNAVLIYLTAQVFTSILFMVGPIFFIFILFKQTRSFFDNWINAIIGFALQQIFLIFTLTLFNVLIYNFVKLALSYRVCWDTVWKIDTFTGSIPLLRFWTVQDAPSFLSDIQNINYSGDNNNTNPSLTPILSIWSLTLIMKSFINSITDLASTLAGGIDASSLGNGIKDSMNGMLKETASKINKIYEKSGAQKAVQKLDQSLFNSGQLAKNERLMRKRANVNDKRLAQKINSAGDKAVRDYKINNATEFKNIKDPQEQKNKLQKIKAEAMKNEAKKAGKNDEQIKTMMKEQKNDGSKILNAIRSNLKNNDNIFQGIARAIDDIRNPIYSLDNKSKEVDPKMNKNEIEMAIEKIDRPEERDEFVKNIKNDGGFKKNEIQSFENKAKELEKKDKNPK